jgi:hypothetical protein
MGKLLLAFVLAFIGVAMIPQIRRKGIVSTGWFVFFFGTAITVLVVLTLARPY